MKRTVSYSTLRVPRCRGGAPNFEGRKWVVVSEVTQPPVEHAGWPLHAIGRRASTEIAYMLPRHPSEIDRLDVQHYALRAALRGNYVAPIEDPGRILDVGSGTGQWGYDLCVEFPHALVVGLDLEPGKPERPSNYRFVRANVLQGLPFADDCFGFVHQRLMMTSVPVVDWPDVVGELVRVTRADGFVELAEFGDRMEPAGPATKRLWELANRLAASRGIDSTGEVLSSLDDYLRRAGAVEVQRQYVALPVGNWGGTIGSMMASDVRALFTRLCVPLEAYLDLAAGECGDLLGTALQECELYQTNAVCTFAYGRKAPSGHC